MAQLALVQPRRATADLVCIAEASLKARRLACLKVWGNGARMVDHAGRERIELLRGDVLLATAARHASDVRPPGALDRAAWLRRQARAGQTFAMKDRRAPVARHPKNRGPAEKGKAIVVVRGPRRLQLFNFKKGKK
jgi:hypothetical protein